MPKTAHLALITAGTIAATSAISSAGVVRSRDTGLRYKNAVSFERAPLGEAVDLLNFTPDLVAKVTHTNPVTNSVFEGSDGSGGVATHGDRAWRLRGGEVRLNFSQSITSFGFEYSDLEFSTLSFNFGDTEKYVLFDYNPSTPRSLDWSGQEIDFVTVSWGRNTTDAVAFDNLRVTPSIPGPSTMALAMAGLLCLPAVRRPR